MEEPALPVAKEKALRQREVQTRPNPSQAPLLNEWPSHIEARKQVGLRKRDMIIGANHKGAIVTMV